jgi:hypothetical protein
MELLSFDISWMILSRIPIRDIFRYRAISHTTKTLIDATSQSQWKDLYHKTVCPWLHASLAFDWRKACIFASRDRGIPATCTWNLKLVYVVIPWVEISDCIVIGTPFPLRDGVKTMHTFSNAVDYIYYDEFRLRSVTDSCRQRADSPPCCNCTAKKMCTRLRKRYYIRNIKPLERDARSTTHHNSPPILGQACSSHQTMAH